MIATMMTTNNIGHYRRLARLTTPGTVLNADALAHVFILSQMIENEEDEELTIEAKAQRYDAPVGTTVATHKEAGPRGWPKGKKRK